jgi:hypothetical protein
MPETKEEKQREVQRTQRELNEMKREVRLTDGYYQNALYAANNSKDLVGRLPTMENVANYHSIERDLAKALNILRDAQDGERSCQQAYDQALQKLNSHRD